MKRSEPGIYRPQMGHKICFCDLMIKKDILQIILYIKLFFHSIADRKNNEKLYLKGELNFYFLYVFNLSYSLLSFASTQVHIFRIEITCICII